MELKAIQLTKQYGSKTAVNHLNLSLSNGVYGLLGANGAGKTTLKVDRLTLQIALMKIQGYSTREIAVYLDITEKAVYRRMDRLKEKLKKFFE